MGFCVRVLLIQSSLLGYSPLTLLLDMRGECV